MAEVAVERMPPAQPPITAVVLRLDEREARALYNVLANSKGSQGQPGDIDLTDKIYFKIQMALRG